MSEFFARDRFATSGIIFWYHIKDDYAVRQIEATGTRLVFLDASNFREWQRMADQPLYQKDFKPSELITREEFEAEWAKKDNL